MNKPPTWFYVLAVALTAWAMMGCYSYLYEVGMSSADLAGLPAAERAMRAAMPTWITGIFAIAVWSGLVGALCLLARMRFAITAFIVSLVAVVVQFGYTFVATPLLSAQGIGGAAFPIVIALVAVLEIWTARTAAARGWLR